MEAESNKIGNRTLPPAVWQAMQRAPRIELSAPIEARADYLVRAYPEVIADRSLLDQVLSRLEVYPGRKQLANWRTLADSGEYAELVRQVVERHYDPSYASFHKHDNRPKLGAIALSALDDVAQLEAAEQIVRMMRDA